MLGSDPNAAFDVYAHFAPADGPASNQIWPTAAMAATFVTSSLNYDRYVRFGLTEGQIERTRSHSVDYDELFKLPYRDERPSDLLLFNQVIRIVALDSDAGRLGPISQAIRQRAPNLDTILVNAGR